MPDHASDTFELANVAPPEADQPETPLAAPEDTPDSGHADDGASHDSPSHAEAVPADAALDETYSETGHAEHGAKPGLPQLDVTTFAGQLFWLVISLVALYVILSRLALPKVQGVLADRATKLKNDLDAAAHAKKASEDAIHGYDKALADARAKAVKASDTLRAQVQSEINAKADAAGKKLAADTAQAEARIGAMRTSALSKVGDVARDAAADIVARLTGEAPAAGAVDAAVQAAMKRGS